MKDICGRNLWGYAETVDISDDLENPETLSKQLFSGT
jgi:hypothetical protein